MMLNNKNIFSSKNLILFSPFSIECLWHIIAKIKDNRPNISFNDLKSQTLEIIEYFLNYKLFFLIEKITDDKKFIRSNKSDKEIIEYIEKSWNEDTEFIDLYILAWFRYESWYRDGLVSLGLTPTTNWEDFVSNNIGNLEKWIKKNKPK